ncbi:adenylate/guanylate cyclase domain-containing protein [Streptomyces sp. NPDC051567]|uniref:adenylate/guanylate cyclase domain-containing protein n=1 Tax=Streptomyces sp. NPDC051567 TaxID=3365660 RepID=UPI00379B9D9C
MTCQSCAAPLPGGARFCARCGTPVADRAPVAEERRVVTVLFCDLVGSTELSGTLDVEVLRSVLLRYYALMESRIEAHGGVVEKFIGDAVMAVFGLTVTREDDARRALETALDLLDALGGLNVQLEQDHRVRLGARIGVHTGEVVTTADPARRQALVSGEVVNIAARLEQAAGPGEVLLSAQTWRACGPGLTVAGAGPLPLKGVAGPIEAARLLGLSEAERAPRSDVPFVGRERYLSELDLAWRRVAEERDVHVLTLLGEAGIGKTRLVDQWLRRSAPDPGRVGAGRCRAAGTGGSLHALAECVAPLAEETERHAVAADGPATAAALALLRTGLLFDGTPAPSEDATCAAVAHVLTARTGEQPVLLVLDDLHWADRPFLELLDRLVEDLRRLPVLVLCLARPELMDADPAWGSGRANSTTVTLTGLAPEDSAVLAAHLVDLALHDPAATGRIVAQADGNPLYLEQLAAMVEEAGGAEGLPPTLHALLAARIDRLDETARTALRHAAVVGREFDVEDLDALAGPYGLPGAYVPAGGTAPVTAGTGTGRGGTGAAVGVGAAVLRTLTRRGLVEPMRRPFGASAAYCFVNGVTQRVAYEGLTKSRRGELHEQYAEYLLRSGCSDAVAGTHLEQAYRYRSAVGRRTELNLVLRHRALRLLARAGAGALGRVDLPWALTLFQRADGLAEPGDPGRPEVLQGLGEVLLALGRSTEARETLLRAVAEADAVGESAGGAEACAAAGTAAHARLHLAAYAHDEAALERAALDGLETFRACGDELGLARSRLLLAGSCQRRGQHGRALEALGHALTHSLASAADRELANTLGAIGLSLWHGPEPAPSAAARCEALLTAHGTDRLPVQVTLGFPLTVLYAVQGRSDRAAACLAAGQRAMAALAYGEGAVFGPLLHGTLTALADRPEQARPALREALASARALRAGGLVRTTALELARAHLAAGQWRRAAELVEELVVPDGQPVVRANRYGVQARIRALGGSHAEALLLAREAVLLAHRTDSPADQATACLDLAYTRAALGRPRQARSAILAARRRFTAKEHLVGVARTRRLMAELGLREEPEPGPPGPGPAPGPGPVPGPGLPDGPAPGGGRPAGRRGA